MIAIQNVKICCYYAHLVTVKVVVNVQMLCHDFFSMTHTQCSLRNRIQCGNINIFLMCWLQPCSHVDRQIGLDVPFCIHAPIPCLMNVTGGWSSTTDVHGYRCSPFQANKWILKNIYRLPFYWSTDVYTLTTFELFIIFVWRRHKNMSLFTDSRVHTRYEWIVICGGYQ